MVIDAIIIVILLILALIGYKKGFIVGILNLVVVSAYLFVAFKLDMYKYIEHINEQAFKDLNNNEGIKIALIIVVGLLLMVIFNFLMRKIIDKSFLSTLDKIGGVLIAILIGYVLICFSNIVIVSIDSFIELPKYLSDSFFLGRSFEEYNILKRLI